MGLLTSPKSARRQVSGNLSEVKMCGVVCSRAVWVGGGGLAGLATLSLNLDCDPVRVEVEAAGGGAEYNFFGAEVDVTPRDTGVVVGATTTEVSRRARPWSRDALVTVETAAGSVAFVESVLVLKRPNNPEVFFLSSFESVDACRARIGRAIDCGPAFDVSGLSMGDGAMDDGVLSISESVARSGGGSRADRTGAAVDTCPATGPRADWDSGADGREGKGCVETVVEEIGCEYLRGEGGFCTADDDAVMGKDTVR
jgi:hypothetical protein